ncbi:hypothetical protein COD90_07235 [Bacillus cereus]|uniref:hypothetical protein n=1 Tax=Bacillus sp. OE TaxID=2293320 RepID=UPI000BFE2998|nr:hypothetical protein COD90_07235 [Bacillus cereus]RFB12436.1 hypothetical protein DZB88_17085 [Bacillus sp. OE]
MRFLSKSISIVLIFILGYFFGYIGLNNVMLKLIEQIEKISFITLIGVISSIITVILFIAYIAGRIFLIRQMEMTLLESLDISSKSTDKQYNLIEELEIGDNTVEEIFITSSQPLRYIKIYNYDVEKMDKGELIKEIGPIRHGHSIKINTYLTCGIPNFVLEYQRFDFVIGRLELSENGKSGILTENLLINHTFRSYIYYIVK